LFTTDRGARLSWVIMQFAWRWSIEVLFRASNLAVSLTLIVRNSLAYNLLSVIASR
jgi:hypothetical protein